MGKTHKALKKAEKEYAARKRQQLTERRQPSPPPKKAYLILTTFIAMICGLFYLWPSSTDDPANIAVIFRKFERNNVTTNSPAQVPSHTVTLDEVPGMQPPEFQKDVKQLLKVPSRPEPNPIASPPTSINADQIEDQKSNIIIAQPLDRTQVADIPPEGADPAVDATKSDQNEPAYQSQNTPETSDLQISPKPTAESEFFEEPSMAPVISAKPTVEEQEEPPDPGKLIDWLLKKRSTQNE